MPTSGNVPPPGGNSGIQNINNGGSQYLTGQQSTGSGGSQVQYLGAAADRDTVTVADLSAAILALRTELGDLLGRTPDALSGASAIAADRVLAEAGAEAERTPPERDRLRGAIDRAVGILGGVAGLAGSLATLQDLFRRLFGG